MLRYDAFLSHANADKADVTILARRLQDQGIEVFLDAWHLIPGAPWQEALEDALDESRTCAVFLGRTIAPWQNEELRSALETRVRNREFRVIPILLPGSMAPGKEELPRLLRRLTWVDFRNGLDDENAFRLLVAGIRGIAPGPNDREARTLPPTFFRSMAPPREAFILRHEYEEVVAILLKGADAQEAATVGLTTALHGAGGFGKTALAQESCHDPRIQARFPDGVLWTTMGEQMTETGRLMRLRDLIRWWTNEEPPAFETVNVAGAHLRERLEGRRLLLVVDDVWHPEDVAPFHGLSPGATLLITTRDGRTLPEKAIAIPVDAMAIPEAIELLGAELPAGVLRGLGELARRLGEWPLLLKIVNRHLRELTGEGLPLEQALREVEEALDAEGLTAFDQKDFESRREAVARTLTPSLRRLDLEENRCFSQLSIFPEDSDLPVSVLAKLWGMKPLSAKRLCARLHDLSLLLRFDRASSTIRLHDVIRAYLLKKHEGEREEIHRQLLAACRPSSGRWTDLPREEQYLWQHLSHHLQGAGELALLRTLLLDPDFLQAKLEATDVSALLSDFAHFLEEDRTLSLLREAIWLAAPGLSSDPKQLAGQLQGRLLNVKNGEVQLFLREMRLRIDRPWLCSRFASLRQPGAALVRNLWEGPEGVTSVATLDEHRIVSGSAQGRLSVWDLESGERVKTIQVCQETLDHLVAIDTSRVVLSNSQLGELQMWDLDSERPVQRLPLRVQRAELLAEHRLLVTTFNELKILDLQTGAQICSFKHPKRVTALTVLPNGFIISSCADGLLRLLTPDGLSTLRSFQAKLPVRALAALDADLIVAIGPGGFAQIIHTENGSVLREYKLFSAVARSLIAMPGLCFVAGSSEGDLVSQPLGDPRRRIFKESAQPITSLAGLSQSRVVAGSLDGTVRIWNLHEKDGVSLDANSPRPASGIQVVRALPTGDAISGSGDGTLCVWDLDTGLPIRTMKQNRAPITGLAVLDTRRVVAGSLSGDLVVWNLTRGQILQRLLLERTGIASLEALDSQRVVSLSRRGKLCTHYLSTGETHDGGYTTHNLLANGWAFGWRTGVLWAGKLEDPRGAVEIRAPFLEFPVVVLVDERWLVGGSVYGDLYVFDLATGGVSYSFRGHSSRVQALAALAKDSFASSSVDGVLRVWEIGGQSPKASLTLDHAVTAIAFNSDDGGIIAGDARGNIHCFDLADP